jgi:lipopolysaccharide/colanic/teichoic acid biosynthesis glycosyltransferase
MKEPNFKRPFDISIALLGLIASSPLWLIIACAVYLEDRSPVFFIQERCGQSGIPFRIIKFRTMKYVKEGHTAHKVMDIEKDPRVTRAGAILRRTAMDELPLLLNIIKGEMSLVGPRPLPFKVERRPNMPYDNIAQVPGYNWRILVKPGLTGISQVYSSKQIDHRKRFRYDRLYVFRMSFCLDLKLILLSFLISFMGRWELRKSKL